MKLGGWKTIMICVYVIMSMVGGFDAGVIAFSIMPIMIGAFMAMTSNPERYRTIYDISSFGFVVTPIFMVVAIVVEFWFGHNDHLRCIFSLILSGIGTVTCVVQGLYAERDMATKRK